MKMKEPTKLYTVVVGDNAHPFILSMGHTWWDREGMEVDWEYILKWYDDIAVVWEPPE